MKERRVYIFTNGILTQPADVDGWTDRACRWVNENTNHKADRFEYFSDAIFRRIWQEKRVDKLHHVLNGYLRDSIILVGHSNGCDIINRLVNRRKHAIREIHLFAAASEPDFNKNGLNRAIEDAQVDRVFCYCSKEDDTLGGAATWSKRLFGWMGLGYGNLGYVGPQNVSQDALGEVETIWKDYNHSDWWKPSEFDSTMRMIVHAK